MEPCIWYNALECSETLCMHHVCSIIVNVSLHCIFFLKPHCALAETHMAADSPSCFPSLVYHVTKDDTFNPDEGTAATDILSTWLSVGVGATWWTRRHSASHTAFVGQPHNTPVTSRAPPGHHRCMMHSWANTLKLWLNMLRIFTSCLLHFGSHHRWIIIAAPFLFH